jgi:hypothetical protein
MFPVRVVNEGPQEARGPENYGVSVLTEMP